MVVSLAVVLVVVVILRKRGAKITATGIMSPANANARTRNEGQPNHGGRAEGREAARSIMQSIFPHQRVNISRPNYHTTLTRNKFLILPQTETVCQNLLLFFKCCFFSTE